MNGVDGKIAEGQRSETEEQHVKGEDSSQYWWTGGIQLCWSCGLCGAVSGLQLQE